MGWVWAEGEQSLADGTSYTGSIGGAASLSSLHVGLEPVAR